MEHSPSRVKNSLDVPSLFSVAVVLTCLKMQLHATNSLIVSLKNSVETAFWVTRTQDEKWITDFISNEMGLTLISMLITELANVFG